MTGIVTPHGSSVSSTLCPFQAAGARACRKSLSELGRNACLLQSRIKKRARTNGTLDHSTVDSIPKRSDKDAREHVEGPSAQARRVHFTCSAKWCHRCQAAFDFRRFAFRVHLQPGALDSD